MSEETAWRVPQVAADAVQYVSGLCVGQGTTVAFIAAPEAPEAF